jgi:hypothetical protein
MRSDPDQLRGPNTQQHPDREISEMDHPHDRSPVECTPTSTNQFGFPKSAVLRLNGGFCFADMQHLPRSAGVRALNTIAPTKVDALKAAVANCVGNLHDKRLKN